MAYSDQTLATDDVALHLCFFKLSHLTCQPANFGAVLLTIRAMKRSVVIFQGHIIETVPAKLLQLVHKH